MKPMGQKPSHFPSKTDCHPGKGLQNWWESEMSNDENKAADRQQGKREIAASLAESRPQKGTPDGLC